MEGCLAIAEVCGPNCYLSITVWEVVSLRYEGVVLITDHLEVRRLLNNCVGRHLCISTRYEGSCKHLEEWKAT